VLRVSSIFQTTGSAYSLVVSNVSRVWKPDETLAVVCKKVLQAMPRFRAKLITDDVARKTKLINMFRFLSYWGENFSICGMSRGCTCALKLA